MSKGAFKYEGTKCMSGKQGALKAAQGKMSSMHGQMGKSTNNNMSHNTGGYRIGEGTRTFKSEGYRQAGYSGGGTAHHKQPNGHKDKA